MIHLIMYLLGVATFISNIVTVFTKGIRIGSDAYYEVRELYESSDSRNVTTTRLYVVKRDFTIKNCSQSDYLDGNLANYKFIVNRITIAYFWIAELAKLILSTIELYLQFIAFRKDEPETDSSSGQGCCCKICSKTCSGCISASRKIMKAIYSSTAYAMPTFLMDAFNYSTPCLQTKYVVIWSEGEFRIIMYYASLTAYAIMLSLLLYRQFNKDFLKREQNNQSSSSRQSSEKGCKGDCRVLQFIFLILLISVLFSWTTSIIVFFQMLIVKEAPKLVVVSGITMIVFSFLSECLCSH